MDILTKEQKDEGKRLKQEIFTIVSEMHHPENIKVVYRMAKTMEKMDWKTKPLNSIELAELTDTEDCGKIMNLLETLDNTQRSVIELKQAFGRILEETEGAAV